MQSNIDLTQIATSTLDDVFRIATENVATSFGDQRGQFLLCVIDSGKIAALQFMPDELEMLIAHLVHTYDATVMALAALDGCGFVQLTVSHWGEPPLKTEALGRFTDAGIDWIQLTSLEPQTEMDLAAG